MVVMRARLLALLCGSWLAAGCSLEGFATDSAVAGGGTGGTAGGGGAGASGGAGAGGAGGCAACACGPWTETRLSSSGPATAPSLAWAGDAWAVAWQDSRDGNDEIYFARADVDGTLLGSELRLTNDGASSVAPRLVWTGSEHAVAYQDDRSGSTAAYLASVDATGQSIVLDLLVWQGTGAPREPAIAWDPTEARYLLVWDDFRDNGYKLHSGVVSASGTAPSGEIRLTDAGGDALRPALAYAELEHGIAWQDSRDGNQEIYFARADPDGYRIGGESRVTEAAGAGTEASLVFDGAGYAVAWSDDRQGQPQIYFARLSQGGVKLGAELAVSSPEAPARSPSLAWDGERYSVAMQQGEGSSGVIVLARLSSDGGLLSEPVPIAGGSAGAARPALAWSGSTWAVAWQEAREGQSAIYLAVCAP